MGGINDSEYEEFYGFCIDFEQRKGKPQEELQKEIEWDEYTISTYGEATKEWKEAKINLEEKKQELSRQIELSMGFGELGGILNNSEEDKIWKANGETRRQESVGNQLPTIEEEGAVISRDFGNDGDQTTLPEQHATDTDEKALGDDEMVGAKQSP